jgi:Fe-S oxidoreductase
MSPRGKNFLASAILRKELGQSNHLAESLYRCTLCGSCKVACPPQVDTPSIVKALRSDLVENGLVPKAIHDVLTNTLRYGNPWGENPAKRSRWGQELHVKSFNDCAPSSILYFVGCTSAYDTRAQEIAKSMVRVFNKAEVDFGTLGNEEKCCGSPILEIGEKGLYEKIATENIESFRKHRVNNIVTTSPHCYDAFTNDYPELSENPGVQHYTQFVAELIDQGKIKMSRSLRKKVVYHDPCVLGRRNSIYEAPRKILESIPGITLLEMDKTKENSYCCGGGGGMMWTRELFGERPSTNRAKQARDLEPDIVATSCPFCLINLEDGMKVIGMDDRIQVKDILELVSEAL